MCLPQQLISDSHGNFEQLQQAMAAFGDDDLQQQQHQQQLGGMMSGASIAHQRSDILLQCSRTYRAMMSAQSGYILDARNQLQSTGDEPSPVDSEKLRRQYERQNVLWTEAIRLWHLAEICYAFPSCYVAMALVEWQFSYSSLGVTLSDSYGRFAQLERFPREAWDLVFTYVSMHGDPSSSKHSASHSQLTPCLLLPPPGAYYKAKQTAPLLCSSCTRPSKTRDTRWRATWLRLRY